MPEIAPASRLSPRRGYFSGSAYALGVILSFCYPFLVRLAIAIGVKWFSESRKVSTQKRVVSKPPLIAVMSESKELSLEGTLPLKFQG